MTPAAYLPRGTTLICGCLLVDVRQPEHPITLNGKKVTQDTYVYIGVPYEQLPGGEESGGIKIFAAPAFKFRQHYQETDQVSPKRLARRLLEHASEVGISDAARDYLQTYLDQPRSSIPMTTTATTPAKRPRATAPAPSKTETAPRGRAPGIPGSAVITVLVPENPHRVGTKAFDTFNLYRTGMTVQEFRQQAHEAAYLAEHIASGHIAVA